MYEQEEGTRDQTEMETPETETEIDGESLPDSLPPQEAAPQTPDSKASETDEAPASAPDPDTTPQALPTASMPADADTESLRQELRLLRQRLEEQTRMMERMGAECEEFRSLYPDSTMESLPDEVWSSVKSGIPLAAAYALAQRRAQRTAELARQRNQENTQRSPGAVKDASSGCYTPDEVRAMTPAEVRKNYQSIMLSMQKWR